MFRHLLVTLDGSPRGESVLPYASTISRSMGAEVTLLRVVDAGTAEWSERGAIGKAAADATAHARSVEQAEAYLERIAVRLADDASRVRTIVRQGHPAREIVATARELDADAIAMATHSRRGINRLMFGSVAEQVLHESSLPVLLIRAA
ncbi:MAG TPA: universal stress protein [Dehalococcoidia bacterium]|nr:universal stress protein [Dehalococcoidia bacterium]